MAGLLCPSHILIGLIKAAVVVRLRHCIESVDICCCPQRQAPVLAGLPDRIKGICHAAIQSVIHLKCLPGQLLKILYLHKLAQSAQQKPS